MPSTCAAPKPEKAPSAAAAVPPGQRPPDTLAAAAQEEAAEPPVADSPLHVASKAGDAEKVGLRRVALHMPLRGSSTWHCVI
jgi:hypothetical protein